MSSIVLELQQAALDKRTDVDDLLRRCVLIASKLHLDDFLSWARKELGGYEQDDIIPPYRSIPGELKVRNPYNNIWMSVIFSEGPPLGLRQRLVATSVAEIQHVLKGSDGPLVMPYPEKDAYQLMKAWDAPTPPVLMVERSSLCGILDAIRNVILEWSLKLEAGGILGEGMTFTQQEKRAASSPTYNIQNFSGVLGNVSAKQVQIGGFNAFRSQLKELGISQSERNALEDLMDKTEAATGSERKSLVKRGFEWVVRNGEHLGALSDTIRGWFEQFR